ncbi:MAG: hypothetical protein H7X77_07045 [Anaerolineae bacterium]|nr:hypothetical protein [Anaerolineae bacterium]
MSYTLKWISTYVPIRDKRTQGFAPDTATVIRVRSGLRALNIFRAWIALFEAGPARLRLRIDFIYTPDGGTYKYVEVSRDELIAKLEGLVGFMQQVIASKGKLYVLCTVK